MQYKLDNALTFQILTEDEQCILLLNNGLWFLFSRKSAHAGTPFFLGFRNNDA
jgi:hypothetical protein